MSAPAGAEVIVEGVSKSFGRISALTEISLHVQPSEAVAITGRSGSGKSTLLALIGGLEQPDSRPGADRRPRDLEAGAPARARREIVGFVFQRHLLLGALSARANVEVPLIGAGMHRADRRRRRALSLLEEVGLADRAEHLPVGAVRAARASAWPWPARSPTSRACCSPTSPPGRWTRAPPSACSTCSSACATASA